MENRNLLTDAGHDVDIIVLKRDLFEILWSFYNRFDIANHAFTWMTALDRRDRNKIVRSEPMKDGGAAGIALWYILEVWARAHDYQLLYEGEPRIRFHRVDLADLKTPVGAQAFVASVRRAAVSDFRSAQCRAGRLFRRVAQGASAPLGGAVPGRH